VVAGWCGGSAGRPVGCCATTNGRDRSVRACRQRVMMSVRQVALEPWFVSWTLGRKTHSIIFAADCLVQVQTFGRQLHDAGKHYVMHIEPEPPSPTTSLSSGLVVCLLVFFLCHKVAELSSTRYVALARIYFLRPKRRLNFRRIVYFFNETKSF
jgi:hypothetical protein